MQTKKTLSANLMSLCKNNNTKTVYPFVMWSEWICMQNNEMSFTWRDNVLGKYISFSVMCPCYHERQWTFHIRNATCNYTVYYAQNMVVPKPEKIFCGSKRKEKNGRELSLLISKMQPISLCSSNLQCTLTHMCNELQNS